MIIDEDPESPSLQLQKSPTSSGQDSPPLTPISENSNDMSYEQDSPEILTRQKTDTLLSNSTPYEDSEKKSLPVHPDTDFTSQQEHSVVTTYLVSLLHALPFIFRVNPPPNDKKGGALQSPGPQELAEIMQELDAADLYRMSRVPTLINPLFLQRNRTSTYAALRALPISLPAINMALILISAIYPYHYGWNYLGPSPTSPATQKLLTLVSKFISRTETYYYSQIDGGIAIHDYNNQFKAYFDKSFTKTCQKDYCDDPEVYPYGWTPGIEEFCQTNSYHPDCTHPVRCANVEKQFIAFTIHKTEKLQVLEEYLQAVFDNRYGRNLQWLHSSPAPVEDNLQERTTLTKLYKEVGQNQGHIYHTQQGLHITIPEERWTNWKTFSPDSQKAFTRVAWAQLTQFNKSTLMTGIHLGKLNDVTIYFNFDEQAKHDKFWTTELESVRKYYIELITHTGAFYYYNPFVVQDLAYYNKPLELPIKNHWENRDRPRFIHLPYSQTMLQWNPKLNKWNYENHDKNSLSSCSSLASSICSCTSCLAPSYTSPIDQFEMEEKEVA